MEASLIASPHVKTMGRSMSFFVKQFGYCNPLNPSSFVLAGSKKNFSLGFRSSSASPISPIFAAHKEVLVKPSSSRKTKSIDGGRLYVSLPLNLISECNTINQIRAIKTGLKALKLLGIDGVELPIWWGVVEKSAGDYNWSAYLELAELIQSMGLKIHASFYFNGSKDGKSQLPEFVAKIGEANPDVFFTDKLGQRYKDCLSLSVDDLPVLDGRTPVQAYEAFCESFKVAFGSYLDSTVTGITMGLGPNGELCYPSQQAMANCKGVGEFQCYDKYTLLDLKQHGESTNNPLWGLGGPHDAPRYDDAPSVGSFFKDEGGSWETPYGEYFLSWYSSKLVAHGDRLLSMASRVFGDTKAVVSGKIPLSHRLCATRSHPCELTSGFYNTATRNGYEAVTQMFAKNEADLVVSGMDLLDAYQGLSSRPQSLIDQIKEACRNNGVGVIGQNLIISSGVEGNEQIKKNLSDQDGVVDQFIYQRMGAEFFSPKNFPVFTKFVRSLSQPETHSDDLAAVRSRLNEHAQAN